MTVLVVDDHPMMREAYRAYLESIRHVCIAAANGAEALEMLRQGVRPDMILLDLSMPTMNGWEFRAAQRADPDLDRIPVIVLSGEQVSRQEVERLGCCGILRKPSPIETIDAALERGRVCGVRRGLRPPANQPDLPAPGRNTASSCPAP